MKLKIRDCPDRRIHQASLLPGMTKELPFIFQSATPPPDHARDIPFKIVLWLQMFPKHSFGHSHKSKSANRKREEKIMNSAVWGKPFPNQTLMAYDQLEMEIHGDKMLYRANMVGLWEHFKRGDSTFGHLPTDDGEAYLIRVPCSARGMEYLTVFADSLGAARRFLSSCGPPLTADGGEIEL